jgi:hypothetical protein
MFCFIVFTKLKGYGIAKARMPLRGGLRNEPLEEPAGRARGGEAWLIFSSLTLTKLRELPVRSRAL